jgi:putative ABC transport system permease protein
MARQYLQISLIRKSIQDNMLKEFFVLTFKGISHRPVRSWLTVLGIVIGIMLVVVIFTLSAGVKNAIGKQLQQFGNNLLIILPGKETGILTGIFGGQKFKFDDIIDLENISGVKLALPVDAGTLNADFDGEKKAVFIHSSRLDRLRAIFEGSRGVKMWRGDWPKDERSNELVLGYLAGNSLYKKDVKVGDEIIVQSKIFRVAGILELMGDKNDDNSFYMSWEIFHLISGTKPGVMSAIVAVLPGQDINLMARQIRFQLEKQNEVNEFTILTPGKTNQIIDGILKSVEFILIVIALVSLVVGAVGIMNTLYTSVLERTKQIGIMKAVGASNDAIMSLFLIESGIIGLVGGIVGILSGLFLSYVIGFLAEKSGFPGLFSAESIDYLQLFVILIITFITGVLSGILPARQASRLQPAEALRYE